MSNSMHTPLLRPNDNGKLWTSSQKQVWAALLCAGCASLYLSRVALPLAAPELARDRGWSKQDSGAVLASFFWGYALTQVAGGYLSDRVGGARVLAWSAVAWSLVTLSTPEQVDWAAPSLVPLTLSRVLAGALQGVHFPAISSLVSAHLLPQHKSLFMGIVTCGPALGMLLSGSVGSLILRYLGWHSLFRSIGLVGLLWVVVLRCFLPRTPTCSTASATPAVPVPWGLFFRSPAFWSMLFAHLSEANAFFILLSWLPTYFSEKFPEAQPWVCNVVPWLVQPVASLLAGWLADTLIASGWRIILVRKVLESGCHLTKASLFLLLTWTHSYPVALCSMAMIVASGGLHCAGVFLNPQDIAPHFTGSIFGVMNTMGSIPGVVGVYLTGYLLDTSGGDWSLVFILTAMLNLAGGLAFLVFGSADPIALPPSSLLRL